MKSKLKLYLVTVRIPYLHGDHSEELQQKFIDQQHNYVDLVSKIKGASLANYSKSEWSHPFLVLDSNPMVVSADELAAMVVRKVEMDEIQETSVTCDITSAVMAVADKPIKLVEEAGNQFNSKVDVHMPGQALAMYNDTLLLEDSCTDVLQDQLSKGWRIIAACPQPDQRRPDYILGRYNPEVDR